MIEVRYLAGETRVVAVEKQGTIKLARVFVGERGLVYCQPRDITFREGRGGMLYSSPYAVGEGRTYGRKIHGTVDDLRAAFAKARIPVNIVTLAENRARIQAQGTPPVQKLDLAA